MSTGRVEIAVHGAAGEFHRDAFLADVQRGMRAPQRTIPSKYLYDEPGSTLFDRICEVEEYYVTRTETAIMSEHAAEMAELLGPGCLLLEYGSGTSTKTYDLLDHLPRPVAYAPIDVAREHLIDASQRIADAYPDIEVLPIWGDFTTAFEIPDPASDTRRRAVYFPGSTLGNLTHEEAEALLGRIAGIVGPGGALLIGIDLVKDRDVLRRAYDDEAGVTEAFNLNVLARINRELDADFDLERFSHRIQWDEEHQRIEMHLESQARQEITIAGETYTMARGETIRTEYSHKFTLDGFAAIARRAGLEVRRVWLDELEYFSVQYLEVPSKRAPA